MKNLKDNKVLSIIGTILYDILVVLIVCILAVVLLQRVSNNNFAIGGIRIFNIVSESMVPKYNIGDILVAKSIDPSQIKVGDDISYLGEVDTFKDKIVTHQVIAIDQKDGKYVFTTKGIANDEADPLITQDQVYGKIVYHTIFLSLISKVILNIYGFYFLIFVPLTILILVKIREILLSIKESKEEKKNEEKDSKEKLDKPEETKKEKED